MDPKGAGEILCCAPSPLMFCASLEKGDPTLLSCGDASKVPTLPAPCSSLYACLGSSLHHCTPLWHIEAVWSDFPLHFWLLLDGFPRLQFELVLELRFGHFQQQQTHYVPHLSSTTRHLVQKDCTQSGEVNNPSSEVVCVVVCVLTLQIGVSSCKSL